MTALIKFEDLDIAALTVMAAEQYEECLWAIEKALDKQLAFGRLLRIVKEKLPHGEWGAWVRSTFTDHKSLRTIQRYMRGADSIATDPSLLECADSLDGVLKIVEDRKPKARVIENGPVLDGAPTYWQRLDMWSRQAEDYDRRVEDMSKNPPDLNESDLSDTVSGFPHFRKLRDWMCGVQALCAERAIHNRTGLRLRDECPGESAWMLEWATQKPTAFDEFVNSLRWLCDAPEDTEFIVRRQTLLSKMPGRRYRVTKNKKPASKRGNE